MTWNGEYPQLTPCLSQTVLPLIPLIVLLLIISYDLILVKKWSKRLAPIPYQWKVYLNLVYMNCKNIFKKFLNHKFSSALNCVIDVNIYVSYNKNFVAIFC
jgi:hypothetical protein